MRAVSLADVGLSWADGSGVELAGEAGTFSVRVTDDADGAPEAQVIVIAGQTYITLEDFVLAPPKESSGLHWTAQLDGHALDGTVNLTVRADDRERATIMMRGTTLEEGGISIEVVTSIDAAEEFVRFCEQVLVANAVGAGDERQYINAACSSFVWPKWYCGCEWGGGNMSLCPANSCPPAGPRACLGPPTPPNCYWFCKWWITPADIDTGSDEGQQANP